jgi:hypothetical protein
MKKKGRPPGSKKIKVYEESKELETTLELEAEVNLQNLDE